jgi:predicted MFS family arabinose efflux permease
MTPEDEAARHGIPALTPEGNPLLSTRYRTWLVGVLLVLGILNFADRAILSVLAQPIKEDLLLTDTDLGMLQGLGFAILYAVLGLPLGWMAERVNRKALLGVCVAAWSFMTAVCGLATNFLTLLLGRVGVGIGEAGYLPVVSSLVGDHFPPNRRASIIAIILLGSPLGFLLGQAVGGFVAATWNWRVAFMVLGVPGLLAALVTWLTLREPPRGLAEAAMSNAPPPSIRAVFAMLWAKPAFRHLLAGFTIAGFAMNAVAQFVLPFYLRSFGLPLATAGAIFGAVAFSSNGLGMVLGGFGFDRLSRRDPRWSLWGPAIMFVVATPLYFGAFSARSVTVSLVCVWFANLALVTYVAPSYATLQNLVGPRMRATTIAIVAMVLGLLATGLGPTLLGIASDAYASARFAGENFIATCPGGRAPTGADAALDVACRSAASEGLRLALISALAFFAWASVHYVAAARTLRRDLYAPVPS